MIEGLDTSALDFFHSVEYAIVQRKIPNKTVSRVHWNEGGIFSAKREYLRVRRKDLAFDIGAAPFGNGFFVSYWLGETPSIFWAIIFWIPVIGPFLTRKFRTITYYKVDTANMFQSLVHSSVLEVVDSLVEAKGLRALSESDKKPTMKNVLARL